MERKHGERWKAGHRKGHEAPFGSKRRVHFVKWVKGFMGIHTHTKAYKSIFLKYMELVVCPFYFDTIIFQKSSTVMWSNKHLERLLC